MFPKQKLYQRLHICAHPFYSKFVRNLKIPKYIIKPKSKNPAIEYQFCTAKEDYWAEYGKAAHTNYKERSFHRLGVPLLIELDKQLGKVRLHRFDECMKKFHGYEFKNMFNIDYQEFLETFDTQQRDKILSGNLKVVYDEKNQEYNLEEVERAFILFNPKDNTFVKTLLKSTTKEQLQKFYEANNLLDNTIYPNNLKGKKIVSPKIKVYNLVKNPREKTHQKLNTKNTANKTESQTGIAESNSHIFEDGPEQ